MVIDGKGTIAPAIPDHKNTSAQEYRGPKTHGPRRKVYRLALHYLENKFFSSPPGERIQGEGEIISALSRQRKRGLHISWFGVAKMP
jgi:hypothetical protein